MFLKHKTIYTTLYKLETKGTDQTVHLHSLISAFLSPNRKRFLLSLVTVQFSFVLVRHVLISQLSDNLNLLSVRNYVLSGDKGENGHFSGAFVE